MTKTLLATMDTFTKRGRYVPRGAPVDPDEVDYEEGKSANLTDYPADAGKGVIEMSAIAPSGPNPTTPQQLAPGTIQTEAGYVDRGVRVIGEVTAPADVRRVEIVEDDNTQAQVEDALAEHATAQGAARVENDDDGLVAGTVADVTAGLSDADDAELDRLLAAEQDREKPRKGVVSAIEAEQASRNDATA